MAAKRSTRKPKTPQPSVSDCNSPLVIKRLSRIESNYEVLDDLLSDLEARLPEPSPPPGEDVPPNKPR